MNDRRENAANRLSVREKLSQMDIILSNQANQDFADAVNLAQGRIAARNAAADAKMRSRNAKLQAFAEVIFEQYVQDTIPEYTNNPTPFDEQYNPKYGEDYRKAKENYIRTHIMKQKNEIQQINKQTALENNIYLASVAGAYVFRCISKKLAKGNSKKNTKNYSRTRELQIMHGDSANPPNLQQYLSRGEIPKQYTQGNASELFKELNKGAKYPFTTNDSGWDVEAETKPQVLPTVNQTTENVSEQPLMSPVNVTSENVSEQPLMSPVNVTSENLDDEQTINDEETSENEENDEEEDNGVFRFMDAINGIIHNYNLEDDTMLKATVVTFIDKVMEVDGSSTEEFNKIGKYVDDNLFVEQLNKEIEIIESQNNADPVKMEQAKRLILWYCNKITEFIDTTTEEQPTGAEDEKYFNNMDESGQGDSPRINANQENLNYVYNAQSVY